MSLDIGEGTKPLFNKYSENTDEDDEQTDESKSSQDEEEKSNSDISNQESDNEDKSDENSQSNSESDNIKEIDHSENDEDNSENNSDNTEQSEPESENDQERDSEDSESNESEQKSIHEPSDQSSSHHRRVRSHHHSKPQSDGQSNKSSSLYHGSLQKEATSRYSATSNLSKCQDIHDLAMHFKPLPTHSVQLLEDLLSTLLEERKQKALSGDFEGSVTILRVIDHTKEYLNIAEKREFQRQQKYQVSMQDNEVKERIAKFDQETQKQEKQLKNNLAKAREKLISDLQREARQQEEYWQSESHMRLYNRPSHKLRTLRHQANQMVACGRFKDAEEVMKVANKLQQEESKQGAYQMQKDYENATKLFDQKVKDELHTFDTDAVNQIETLRARRASMRTVFQNQVRKVEQRSELVKDVDRCWNANMRTIVEQKMSRKGQHPDVMPRTTRALGRSLREKQDNVILSLPKLNPMRPMGRPIPAPDYL